ncbi:MAG: serine hydrolase [Bacteroidetes bacterium]|nr:serine hydrolase [Bacteroidota bacterium]
MKSLALSILTIIILSCSGFTQVTDPEIQLTESQNNDSFEQFEIFLDKLRINLKIPAISAAVIENHEIIWAKGFGYADIEKDIKATDSTSFRVASITKTYASTIIMQLVNEGKINLEFLVSNYGVDLSANKKIKVKHLLSHTSQYKPGKIFRYSGARFGYLEDVIINASGKTFGELFIERIIIPLDLMNTAPSVWNDITFYPEVTGNFNNIYEKLANPYRLKEDYSIGRSKYIMGFMVAGGLVTTVHDMAKFNIALDTNFFFDELITKKNYSPTVSTDGRLLPYGLGWFVQDVNNLRLLWHYGWHPDAASSLILKVPEKNISFIIFANSDMLSKPFSLHNGNVLNSPAALIFLKTFLPEEFIDFDLVKREKELEEIVFKSAGEKPLLNRSQYFLLIFCQLFFLSAIIFWPLRFIVIKLFPLRFKSRNKEGLKGFLFRFYLFILCLICFFFTGALFYYPPIIYWHELPGWFDGVPLYQNLTLALPSIITLLTILVIPIIFYIWTKKIWVIQHRTHYSVIILMTGIYLMLLRYWHLIGINYYWKYLIYNL